MHIQLPWNVTKASLPSGVNKMSRGAVCAWKVNRGATRSAPHRVSFTVPELVGALNWSPVDRSPLSGNPSVDHNARQSGYP